jgi:hypothetical protein
MPDLVLAHPHDHEGPGGVGGHPAVVLVAGGEGVHLELRPHRAGGVEAPRHDAAAVVAAVVRPGHHEAAARRRSDGGLDLEAGRRGVDRELRALRHARGVEALAEEAEIAAVLAIALPGHHEAAVGEVGHARVALAVRGVRVDVELPALRRRAGVEALAEDAAGVASLRRGPHHDEAPVGRRGDRVLLLVAGGVGRHVELGAGLAHGLAPGDRGRKEHDYYRGQETLGHGRPPGCDAVRSNPSVLPDAGRRGQGRKRLAAATS